METQTSAIALAETHGGDNGGELEASASTGSSSSSSPSPDTAGELLLPITRKRQILVLISGFLTICITIGFNQSYGVFQNYYISPSQTVLPKSTGNNSALVAFVGTLGSGLTWAGSIFVNPTMARLGVRGTRGLGILGVVFMSLGFVFASFSTQVSQQTLFTLLGHYLTCFSVGVASLTHPRPPIRHRFLPAVLPHPERRPGVLHDPSRVRHGLHPLRRRDRRARLLAPDPLPPDSHRAALDVALVGPAEHGHLSPRGAHDVAVALRGAPAHARGLETGPQTGVPAQRGCRVPAGWRQRAASYVSARVFGGAGLLGGRGRDAAGCVECCQFGQSGCHGVCGGPAWAAEHAYRDCVVVCCVCAWPMAREHAGWGEESAMGAFRGLLWCGGWGV